MADFTKSLADHGDPRRSCIVVWNESEALPGRKSLRLNNQQRRRLTFYQNMVATLRCGVSGRAVVLEAYAALLPFRWEKVDEGGDQQGAHVFWFDGQPVPADVLAMPKRRRRSARWSEAGAFPPMPEVVRGFLR